VTLLRRLLRPLATLLSFVASCMLVGAAHGWLPQWSTVAIFALTLGIIALVIFVHELGHALAFRWQGGVVDEIAVMFVAWRRRPAVGRGRIGLARRLGGDVGGYVIGHFGATIPTRRKAMIVAAAGPLANGLLTALCLTLSGLLSLAMPTIWPDHALAMETAVIVEGPVPAGIEPARLPDPATVEAVLAQVDRLHRLAIAQGIIMLIALNSLMTGLINLIPFTGSDGAAILRLWLNSPASRRRAG
jgi:hypothetical protein